MGEDEVLTMGQRLVGVGWKSGMENWAGGVLVSWEKMLEFGKKAGAHYDAESR